MQVDPAGNYRVRIDATDIGTGAWTVLTQIAADALEVPPERVQLEIGDSALPKAGAAGGSSGTASWGWAIVNAASALRTRLREEYGGSVPAGGLSASGAFETNPEVQQFINGEADGPVPLNLSQEDDHHRAITAPRPLTAARHRFTHKMP